mgnify:CR=1 FL=1
MLDILTRAGSFVAIIVLGYVLKKIGVFKQEDFTVLSKVVIRITLPAAIITSFAGKEIDPAMLAIVLLGMGGGIVYIIAAMAANIRSTKEDKAFEVLNLPGYNIGNFTMPFVQSFLGPVGVITTSLFDTGNAFVCLGGSFGVASMVKDGTGFSFSRIFKALSKSVPFLTYILMVVMNLLHIGIPGPVLELAKIIANGNAFLAMFMIGVGFKLGGDTSQIGRIVKILAIRYSIAAVLALAFYFLTPFELEARQSLVILAFSPIGSAVPPFTAELKGDVGLSSAINSIAIVISIVIIVVLMSVML